MSSSCPSPRRTHFGNAAASTRSIRSRRPSTVEALLHHDDGHTDDRGMTRHRDLVVADQTCRGRTCRCSPQRASVPRYADYPHCEHCTAMARGARGARTGPSLPDPASSRALIHEPVRLPSDACGSSESTCLAFSYCTLGIDVGISSVADSSTRYESDRSSLRRSSVTTSPVPVGGRRTSGTRQPAQAPGGRWPHRPPGCLARLRQPDSRARRASPRSGVARHRIPGRRVSSRSRTPTRISQFRRVPAYARRSPSIRGESIASPHALHRTSLRVMRSRCGARRSIPVFAGPLR